MSHLYACPVAVRGYECGQDAVVGLPTVLSYLEHCRWQWILVPELGLVDALHDGHYFVVHRATVGLCRTFGIGTSLTVRAALRRVGRVHCEVEQDLVRGDGVLLARARISAIWLGPSGSMARVPDVTRQAVTDEPLVSRALPPDPAPPGSFLAPPEDVFTPTLTPRIDKEVPEGAHTTSLVVRPSDCDLHRHVNNATYLRFFEDALGAPGAIEADVEYRGQAHAGDTLALRGWPVPTGRAFALQRDGLTLVRAVLARRGASR